MAHEIDQNGNANAIAYFGQVPWMGLDFCGDAQPDPYDLPAWIARAGLGWTVKAVEAWARFDPSLGLGAGVAVPADVARILIREDRGTVLGACKGNYTEIQNLDAFQVLAGMLESRRGALSCMASLRGGRDVFATVQIAEHELAPDDTIRWYLVVTTSHDGTSAFRCFLTAIRVVCANTLAVALGNRHATVTIRHTASAHDRLAALESALNSADGTIVANLEAWSAMSRRRVSPADVTAFGAAFLPLPAEPEKHPRAVANVERGRAVLEQLYETGAGADLPSAAGTVWGLYQAATAYVSHVQRAKQAAEDRVRRLWEGSGADQIARAETLALSLVDGTFAQQAAAMVAQAAA